jgi:hypothetical protein
MNDAAIGYPGIKEYSTDRDRYIYPPPAPVSASPGFKAFIALVNTTLAELIEVPSLDPKGLEPADLTQTLMIENSHLKLEFNVSTGSISSMEEKGAAATQWVAPGSALGEFVYRTYTQKADINRYCSQLTPGFQPKATPTLRGGRGRSPAWIYPSSTTLPCHLSQTALVPGLWS